MERDQAQEKIEGALREMREIVNITMKLPVELSEEEKDYRRLKLLVGGEDNLMKYPSRRPESFLDFMSLTDRAKGNNNHL
jgi:hypothetical protein